MPSSPPAPRLMFAERLARIEAILSPCPCATTSAGTPLAHDWSQGPHCAACGLYGFVDGPPSPST